MNRGKEILVVDDDLDLRTMIAEILSDEGYSVATAANGREALQRLQDGTRPSVILLDLMMPEMDGWEFRRRQLAEPQLAPTPVIVFTAHGNASDAAAELSAAAGLQKTVDLSGLLAAIERVVRAERNLDGSPACPT